MWLWRSLQDMSKQIATDFAGHRKILIGNGDLGELDTQKRSIQLITLNKATILSMVVKTLDPLFSLAEKMIIMRGTAAHTGKSSWLEEAVAKDIDGVVPQSDDIYSHWHYRGVCEGVPIDVCHHASKSLNPFTLGYGAIRVAARMQRYYQKLKAQPPALAIRSHNHTYEDSGGNYETFVFFTRAWTTATEYAYRQGLENTLSDIGGHVIECEDGKWKKKDYPFEPREARRIWATKL